jgi:hypothetical protein
VVSTIFGEYFMTIRSQTSVSGEKLGSTEFESVANNPAAIMQGYDHKFRLILTYPKNREFYDKSNLKKKISEFYNLVLQDSQYAIRFKVDIVDAGMVNDSYLLRFRGTLDGEYLAVTPDEVVNLLIIQLESFFTIVAKGEFKSIFLEIDGNIIYKPDNEFIPNDQKENTWERTSQPDFWDDLWDAYIVSELFETLADGAVLLAENIDLDLPDLGDVDTSWIGELFSGIVEMIKGFFD